MQVVGKYALRVSTSTHARKFLSSMHLTVRQISALGYQEHRAEHIYTWCVLMHVQRTSVVPLNATRHPSDFVLMPQLPTAVEVPLLENRSVTRFNYSMAQQK
eukprot:COSAG01_NODE_3394_length_6144_cov_4.826942_2_plen_102_part_00